MSNYTKKLEGKELEAYINKRFKTTNPHKMKDSIRVELVEHLSYFISENNLIKWAKPESDLHFLAFNENYYLIGYYQCEQWLKKHELSVFEAIRICKDYELEHCGECYTDYDNAEILVNHLVYWYGFDLCNELITY